MRPRDEHIAEALSFGDPVRFTVTGNPLGPFFDLGVLGKMRPR